MVLPAVGPVPRWLWSEIVLCGPLHSLPAQSLESSWTSSLICEPQHTTVCLEVSMP